MNPPVLLVATRNQSKFGEISAILRGYGWTLRSLDGFPPTARIVEDGDTYLENARKKAEAAFHTFRLPTLADDSGLEVDALNGCPGVLSSRFSGDEGNDIRNNERLLEFMKGVPVQRRTARFRCVVVYIGPDRHVSAEGVCEGTILNQVRGTNGFGYDPLFFLPEIGKSMAELASEEKNRISHRGRAFRAMARMLIEQDILNGAASDDGGSSEENS
jgi:XTP/dITP diphosphohydrolase